MWGKKEEPSLEEVLVKVMSPFLERTARANERIAKAQEESSRAIVEHYAKPASKSEKGATS